MPENSTGSAGAAGASASGAAGASGAGAAGAAVGAGAAELPQAASSIIIARTRAISFFMVDNLL
ncbi:MAG: hypothetical protein E7431_09890 [Ruminococcaceae bacterium]|nr:hypothetical protein [Oscillospiraceae bacterium]